MSRLAAAALAVSGAAAQAQPRPPQPVPPGQPLQPASHTPPLPQLRLEREPPPRHLRMRPRTAQVTPPSSPPAAPVVPMPAAPPALSQADLNDRSAAAAVRDAQAPVSFSLTLGYQVDGASPSGKPALDAPAAAGGYSTARSYGFGELFFSTRGVVLDGLASYIALRLDAARLPGSYVAPDQTEARVAPPITTWFDRTTFEVRTGWAEVKDFLPPRWGLGKLRLRAGSQFVYGPWVVHLDGALLAYDGDIVTATGYAGGYHADYTRELINEPFSVAGASLRLDLRALAGLPFTVTGETLSLTSDVTGQSGTSHRQLEIDWQPRRDLTVLAQVRTLGDKLANQRLQLRARYREVTNLVFDVMRRFDTDWRWDPSVLADDPMAARRYLDLGPVLPQLIASLRGGTLIAENVDLLARATIASDLTEDGQPRSSFSASYVELGGALDVRLRRTLSLGLSALTRQTERDGDGDPDTADPAIPDERLTPQPLPPSAATGEQQLIEIGTRLRMTLGARTFSAMIELYGRRTRYPEVYVDPADPIATSDVRGGGRVTIDAWIGKRVRLFAAYDLSTTVDHTPEINSYKSLRLTMTGVY